jgi:hypothetical protein
MLLTSMQVIPRSQHEEQSALLRCKVEELNKNTARLIAEAEKLFQESRQLSERIKSFENPRRTRKGAECSRPRGNFKYPGRIRDGTVAE